MRLQKLNEIDKKITELENYVVQYAEILTKTQFASENNCENDVTLQHIRKFCNSSVVQIKKDIHILTRARLKITTTPLELTGNQTIH